MIRPRTGRDLSASQSLPLVQAGSWLAAGLIVRALAARKRSRLGRMVGVAMMGMGSAMILRSARSGASRETRSLATIASGFAAGLDAVQLLHTGSKWRILGTLAELTMASAWLRRAAKPAPARAPGQSHESSNGPPTEQVLDHALEETFPASDPVVITPPERREPLPQL
jgi:hypothetical protein